MNHALRPLDRLRTAQAQGKRKATKGVRGLRDSAGRFDGKATLCYNVNAIVGGGVLELGLHEVI
jgi:hypothetical protein